MNERLLVQKACDLAKRGASEYLTRNNLTASPEALSACLKSWVKIRLPEAWTTAKEALDCHMFQIAETTFAASMINAGIEAAKEASDPPIPNKVIPTALFSPADAHQQAWQDVEKGNH